MPNPEMRRLRRAATQALMSVWSGQRTRRPVKADEYDRMRSHMCIYVAFRYPCLTAEAVIEVVEIGLERFLCSSFGKLWPTGEGGNPEDCFVQIDDLALDRATGRTQADTARLSPTTKDDSDIVAAIFGPGADADAYRGALAAVRQEGGVNEYLVVTQTADLCSELGRVPKDADVAAKLRRHNISAPMVTHLLLNFANRLTPHGVAV